MLEPLRQLVNRGIATSTPARALCQRLEGRVLALQVRDTGLEFYLTARVEGLELGTSFAGEPDALLSGTPLGLALLASTEARNALPSGPLHIEGDPEVARMFRELLVHAQPDWEEEIARLVGDVPAHQIGNAARATAHWARQTLDTLRQDASEFLQEESRDLPAAAEAEDFLAEVDEIRMAVDRLEARIRELEDAQRGNGTGPPRSPT